MADQTKDFWKPRPGVPAGLGTGVFATRQYIPGRGERPLTQIQYTPDIYYPDFVAQMNASPLQVIEFQWVPHSIASYSQLLNADCGTNLPCTRSSGCVTPVASVLMEFARVDHEMRSVSPWVFIGAAILLFAVAGVLGYLVAPPTHGSWDNRAKAVGVAMAIAGEFLHR